ncbi:MAG: hypothetical protein AB7W16_14730 [Candidatus Obscuribacterales bacterium]
MKLRQIDLIGHFFSENLDPKSQENPKVDSEDQVFLKKLDPEGQVFPSTEIA